MTQRRTPRHAIDLRTPSISPRTDIHALGQLSAAQQLAAGPASDLPSPDSSLSSSPSSPTGSTSRTSRLRQSLEETPAREDASLPGTAAVSSSRAGRRSAITNVPLQRFEGDQAGAGDWTSDGSTSTRSIRILPADDPTSGGGPNRRNIRIISGDEIQENTDRPEAITQFVDVPSSPDVRLSSAGRSAAQRRSNRAETSAIDLTGDDSDEDLVVTGANIVARATPPIRYLHQRQPTYTLNPIPRANGNNNLENLTFQRVMAGEQLPFMG